MRSDNFLTFIPRLLLRRNNPGLLIAAVLMAAFHLSAITLVAQQPGRTIELTLETMVGMGLANSYGVRRLQLDIERTRSLLRAEQAGLKSRVELELAAPRFETISDYKWNSDLQRNELVGENNRRWELDLSVRQPVILFGYPTNGTLSLNNRVYRYSQLAREHDVQYYNRYFVEYEQPLFQPNRMKNELEEAEIDLERSELEFQQDFIFMVHNLADDFFELFEAAYEGQIAAARVEDLERAAALADELRATVPARAIDFDQLQVALANAREEVQQAASSYRLQAAALKQRLRLNQADSIVVDTVLSVQPVTVDVMRAVELATALAPRLRRVALDLREGEIDLDEARGRDSFRVDLGLTYGREMQDPRLSGIFQEPRNSYTLNVDATVPLWDWGERKHRIRAQEYLYQRAELGAEETRSEIEANVRSQVRTLEEYVQRAVNMQRNITLARQNTVATLERYAEGEVTLVDLAQTIDRESDTAENFLDAYLGYRSALLRLEQLTFYDFQRELPVLERYRIDSFMRLTP